MHLVKIEHVSREVINLVWDDGKQYAYFIKKLRSQCPCALCRQKKEDSNPLRVLDTDEQDIELLGWNWVGRYAVSLKWSDRHDSGIYTFTYLRKLCEESEKI
jgi:DUF971 family protein